jgi:hypothetical protein
MEEAEELLSRCLNSEERDTPVFQQALLKLARASFNGRREMSVDSSAPHPAGQVDEGNLDAAA